MANKLLIQNIDRGPTNGTAGQWNEVVPDPEIRGFQRQSDPRQEDPDERVGEDLESVPGSPGKRVEQTKLNDL